MKVLFIFFIFCAVSCKTKGKDTILTKESIIIDLDVSKEDVIPYSKYFKSVKTILLETKRESVLGKIDKCLVFDDKIFILDMHDAKALLVFNLDGKFIAKVGNMGRGPGEYQSIDDFTINEGDKELYILANHNTLLKYKTDGIFLNSIRVDIPSSLVYIQYYQGNLFAYVRSFDFGKNEKMLIKINPKTGRVLSEHLDSWQHNCGWNAFQSYGHSFFFPVAGGVPKFAAQYMHSLFSLDCFLPAITIRSKYICTRQDLKDIKEMNFLFRLSFMKLHDISNYIEGTQFIYFNARVEGTTTSVIYDCISKTSKIFSFFQNDLVYKEADQSPKFVFADKNGVYELINSADTRTRTTLVQHIENDNILPDMDKIDQLRKLNEDSNPVIFYYEFKDAE